jgi:hypothetical protein
MPDFVNIPLQKRYPQVYFPGKRDYIEYINGYNFPFDYNRQYNERLKIHSISEFRGWRGMLECGLFKNAIFFRWSTLAAVLCFLYCVTFGCLLWLLFQKLRRKPLNRPYQLALWCGLLEFGYLSSFLVFTPTPISVIISSVS